MRIERIKCSRLTGLRDVDWTFPLGPVLVFCKDSCHQRILSELLLELFYDQETPHILKTESSKGSLEVWLVGENTRFHIRQDFIQQGNEFVRSSTLVSDEVTGHNVSLPENSKLGDYLFKINYRAFRQGTVVNWPEKNEFDHLRLRVNNLRQGGDEGLSLIKVRASLVGAQKRVSEQKGSMEKIKAEYDALRLEWEAAHRQQDDERLLLIEIKNLQENEAIISERITAAIKMQERLTLLTQNPDYRELRQLQEELNQLKERFRTVESNLTTLTSKSEVDWTVIENLREECIEWASLQEQVERLAIKIKLRAKEIAELKGSLQTCGYEGLEKYEDQHLRKVEEERAAIQEELNKLTLLKDDLEGTHLIYSKEIARLQDFVDMTEVTEADEIKIAQRERYLLLWQSSKIGRLLDRTIRKYFRENSIGAKLASRLVQYYEGYKVSNFEEFTIQLRDFRDQQKLVERVQLKIEQLEEKVGREEILRRTVQTRTELLKQAFLAVRVADFPAWLNGWEDYQRNKDQLAIMTEELQLWRGQSSTEEKKLQVCAEHLKEKFGDWDTPTSDRDEVLAAVFKVASQLRAKDEVEREIAECSQKFIDLLGDRNIERLAKKLEPLAELERETQLSDEERLAILTAWQKERMETRKQRAEAEQHLQNKQKYPSLTVLEKKIETVKRQWMAYEDLHSAINDAQILLETSWEEWQTKFGKALNNEMKWILSNISSSLAHETTQTDQAEAMKDYFAYRMAGAQLSLGSYTEVPLFFSVGEIDEGERFWVEVIEFFHKLSLKRQMILNTTNPKLREKLIGIGWFAVNF